MNDKKEMIKQIKWLVVILIIVIGIAIFINIKNSPKSEEKQKDNNISQEIRIDGLTEEEVDSFKELIDSEKYTKYKQTFKDIREGNIPYYEGMTLEPESPTDEKIKKQTEELEKKLKEADENGSWHYFTLEDGTVTNTIIYDNIDMH